MLAIYGHQAPLMEPDEEEPLRLDQTFGGLMLFSYAYVEELHHYLPGIPYYGSLGIALLFVQLGFLACQCLL